MTIFTRYLHFIVSLIASFSVAAVFLYSRHSVIKKLLKFAGMEAVKRLLRNFDAEAFKLKMSICTAIPMLYGGIFHFSCIKHKHQSSSLMIILLMSLMILESLISTRKKDS